MSKQLQQALIVVGVAFNAKGEVLLTQRFDPEFKDAHLKWDLPGGKHEFGETLEGTCRRELLEETGYYVRIEHMIPYHLEHIWESSTRTLEVVIVGFRCNLIDGKPHLNDHKINDIKWVNPAADELELLIGTKEFIEKSLAKPQFQAVDISNMA